MDGWLALKAVGVGIAVAAPVGPMSLLCMQRTLRQGRAQGLAVGAGIAAADFSYAVLGAFGLTALSSVLLAGGQALRLAGVLVLFYFALRIILSRPDTAPRAGTEGVAWRGFASAYLLTLANPPTILFFAALFAAIAPPAAASAAIVFATGVFAGSLIWWIMLTAIVAGTASKLSPPVLRGINLLSGLALIGFAVYGLVRALG
jgi:threonine/homoserine/homoserine lactone efflux protein